MAPNLLFEREALPPPVKEHVYELKMEKKTETSCQKEEKEDKGQDCLIKDMAPWPGFGPGPQVTECSYTDVLRATAAYTGPDYTTRAIYMA